MSLVHYLKPVPGEEYSWVWDHPPFLVRAYVNQIMACWWAMVSKGDTVPIEIVSFKSMGDLASRIEAHLLKEYPVEAERVLYPPPALTRVSEDEWAI